MRLTRDDDWLLVDFPRHKFLEKKALENEIGIMHSEMIKSFLPEAMILKEGEGLPTDSRQT